MFYERSKGQYNYLLPCFRRLRRATEYNEEVKDYKSLPPRTKRFMENFVPADAIDILIGGMRLTNLPDLYYEAGCQHRLAYTTDGRIVRCTLLVRFSAWHGCLCQHSWYSVHIITSKGDIFIQMLFSADSSAEVVQA